MKAILMDRPAETLPRILRLSAVSFFNTAPLVYGLDRDARLRLRFGVPSILLSDLVEDRADVALLPVIDYQRAPDLRIIPATGIGCDGPTLTVRLFSRTPIESTRILAADADSHTSVALARIILQKQYGITPDIIPLTDATDAAQETRLLIGDKVVTDEPIGFDHQLDLGAAWKSMTGLPFVFAVWTVRPGVEIGDLSPRLSEALRLGLENVDELIRRDAIPRRWPSDIARNYLLKYLKFTIGEPQLQAIRQFHQMAHEIGIIDQVDPLRLTHE